VLVTLTWSPAAAAVRDFGVDVSRHQGQTGIAQASWDMMAAEGKTFAYMKATEGLLPPGNIDPAWQANVAGASNAGIRAGVYHFARPDNRPNVAGAIAEAGHFVATAGSAMEAGNLRPVMDLERGNAMSTADLTDWVLAFVDEVVRLKGPAAEPIIYCSKSYASVELDSRVAGLDAWIADLSGFDPYTAGPATSGQFGDWAIWQYSWTGTAGGISPIDLDVLHSEHYPLSSLVIPEPAGGAALFLALLAGRRVRRRVAASQSVPLEADPTRIAPAARSSPSIPDQN
jgi:GH25 family lysozyme M1 (1,4-beta-N-acetylmuramidase)